MNYTIHFKNGSNLLVIKEIADILYDRICVSKNALDWQFFHENGEILLAIKLSEVVYIEKII